ncbi:MAG: hypothetical protein COV67_00355 [Nitrospinae bacterium CG11_big_fil_rev_8_21_14_0_20_56_8]|nr:MAG: hypothetical protein COV67_00355 [Nitrospinae bacterium CG11_big_fil_rev_8_21_14_0_20_56_8]
MRPLKQVKLITCIMPPGRAHGLILALKKEKGIDSANHSGGRGIGVGQPIERGSWQEVDILSVVVEAHRADEIFEFLFARSEINRPHGGFIYQTPLTAATLFSLPDLPLEGA